MVIEKHIPEILIPLQMHALGNAMTVGAKLKLLELSIAERVRPLVKPLSTFHWIHAQVK